ncbi:glutamate--cysteine ligase, partial [Burkholderia pseudomallei]
MRGMRRGVEKEGLRTDAQGRLVHTPHPQALGSALTHPHITTDFNESQLELVTGVHDSAQACVDELTEVHRFVHHVLQPAGEQM